MVGDILSLNTKEVIPCDSVASILARQYYARKAKLAAKTCSLSSITDCRLRVKNEDYKIDCVSL